MISRGSVVFRLPMEDLLSRPIKQCALKRAIRAPESLVFLLKRRERSRVAAERIGAGYSLPFCSRGTLVSHEIPDIYLPPSPINLPMSSHAARKTCTSPYGLILSPSS